MQGKKGTILAFAYGYGGMFAAGNMTLAGIYPITASLGLIHYRSYDEAVNWNVPLCGLSMMEAFIVTVVFVMTTKTASFAKTGKKQKKAVTKKGW